MTPAESLTHWDTHRRAMPSHAARLIWTLDMVEDRKLRRHLMTRITEYLEGCSPCPGRIRGCSGRVATSKAPPEPGGADRLFTLR